VSGEFRSPWYLLHNQRRQEHLASLGLQLSQRTVIEVGAGVGDHTSFFLDRGCDVLTSDAREENVAVLRNRYPSLDVRLLDLDRPPEVFEPRAEVVYCYGTLYHLRDPESALAFMSRCSTSLLLLETCVSPGLDEQINTVEEDARNPSQSAHGLGCRPTRPWVLSRLRQHFEHAYLTTTQPWHPEFPLDWDVGFDPSVLTRSVFVASRDPLANATLTEDLLMHQRPH
jgi:hypothetical protein